MLPGLGRGKASRHLQLSERGAVVAGIGSTGGPVGLGTLGASGHFPKAGFEDVPLSPSTNGHGGAGLYCTVLGVPDDDPTLNEVVHGGLKQFKDFNQFSPSEGPAPGGLGAPNDPALPDVPSVLEPVEVKNSSKLSTQEARADQAHGCGDVFCGGKPKDRIPPLSAGPSKGPAPGGLGAPNDLALPDVPTVLGPVEVKNFSKLSTREERADQAQVDGLVGGLPMKTYQRFGHIPPLPVGLVPKEILQITGDPAGTVTLPDGTTRYPRPMTAQELYGYGPRVDGFHPEKEVFSCWGNRTKKQTQEVGRGKPKKTPQSSLGDLIDFGGDAPPPPPPPPRPAAIAHHDETEDESEDESPPPNAFDHVYNKITKDMGHDGFWLDGIYTA